MTGTSLNVAMASDFSVARQFSQRERFVYSLPIKFHAPFIVCACFIDKDSPLPTPKTLLFLLPREAAEMRRQSQDGLTSKEAGFQFVSQLSNAMKPTKLRTAWQALSAAGAASGCTLLMYTHRCYVIMSTAKLPNIKMSTSLTDVI
jgi:hypothetical protein